MDVRFEVTSYIPNHGRTRYGIPFSLLIIWGGAIARPILSIDVPMQI